MGRALSRMKEGRYSCNPSVGKPEDKRPSDTLRQCCPTFLYIGAHLTDGCGGTGAMWRLQ
jgi:hypothetical protein